MNRWLTLLFIMIFIVACRHDAIIPESPPVSFKNDVQSIIISNCTKSGCHGNTNNEEFTLLTYNDVMNNGEIIPGNAKESKLYKSITGKGEKMMPPDYSLSSNQLQIIFFWITQGAKNN